MSVQIIAGDCRDVLRTLPDASVDSVVTDPPYELGFMGKKWDRSGVANDVRVWAECLRVLKPGGHLVAFGGTRTYHRMVCAIEDAGFDVRDQLGWLYGSGFPKSLDVSKAIDKAAGAEREVIGDKLDLPGYHLNGHIGGEAFGHGLSTSTPETRMKAAQITAPATDAARQWQGWGTALKPAWEPIVLARKPLQGTVTANVLRHGTGALNVDGCRVPGVVESNPSARGAGNISTSGHKGQADTGLDRVSDVGRWPANILHDGSEEVVALFPAAGASAPVRGGEPSVASAGNVTGKRDRVPGAFHADTGSAARFFYTSKASRADRNAGLAQNNHPTVKPTDLMRWLCRLVTPPGGVVLDPFMGSGSTLKAAELEGFSAIGIELEAEYIEIARRRIASDAPLFSDVATLSPIASVSAQDGADVCAAPHLPEAA